MTMNISAEIEKVKRSVHLNSSDLMQALNEYLDLWSSHDKEYCDRLRQRMARTFSDEVRAFSAVRDSIVIQSMRMMMRDPGVLDEYVERLIEQEDDEDFKRLRMGLVGWLH